MKIALLASILLFFPLILISCKKDNPIPPEEQPRINITLEDVSCTEAWIKLSTSNLTFPASVDLLKDSSFVEVINLTSADTILYVDSLLPNKTYSFNSIIQSSNQSIFSDPLQFTTMDTTPHNFTWQSWTFGGQAGSCTLYDVAIINENDIWAVGEIYLLDTLGQPDPLPYNAIHWDGNQWQIKRISVTHNGSSITPPLYGIFTFSAKDLWLSSGVPIHGDGVNWTQYHLFDMGILSQEDGYLTKIWGGTATDIYFVRTLGTIAHYQNGQWSRIESGTEIPLSDICTFNINDIVISGADNL
ncbi:MAG TPA: glucosyl transferase, partial [Ignavibacteriaceae bacterium]